MPRTVVSKSSDIIELLKQAAVEGRIVLMLPAASRYQPARPDNTERALVAALCMVFGLRHGEGRVLVKLMQQGYASRGELHAVISRDDNPNTGVAVVGVTVCSLRRKLKVHGIGIATLHGLGCRLDEVDRDKIRVLLAGYGEDVVGAATPAASQQDSTEANPKAA